MKQLATCSTESNVPAENEFNCLQNIALIAIVVYNKS